MERMTALLMVMVLLPVVSGCSIFKPNKQSIQVTCSESGTILTANGESRTCPHTFEIPRNRDFHLEAIKKGYMPYSKNVGYHLSFTGGLDAVGTMLILFPAIGLISPGAWALDDTEIHVALIPEVPRR